MAIFCTGTVVPEKPLHLQVTITGTGDSSKCYVIIRDTKYTKAASNIDINPGDNITFHVSEDDVGVQNGILTIDGTIVARSTSPDGYTYKYTVPSGISSISVVLSMGSVGNGNITVTTS